MAHAVGAADEVDRALHAADLGTRHEHTLPYVNRALQNVVDVDSCCLIYHNEHSYSRLCGLCHAFSQEKAEPHAEVLLILLSLNDFHTTACAQTRCSSGNHCFGICP